MEKQAIYRVRVCVPSYSKLNHEKIITFTVVSDLQLQVKNDQKNSFMCRREFSEDN